VLKVALVPAAESLRLIPVLNAVSPAGVTVSVARPFPIAFASSVPAQVLAPFRVSV
jgi:hypothetical protein